MPSKPQTRAEHLLRSTLTSFKWMAHDLNLIVYDFFHPSQVKAMVEGRDRRPELGFKLAVELKNAENDNKRNRRLV